MKITTTKIRTRIKTLIRVGLVVVVALASTQRISSPLSLGERVAVRPGEGKGVGLGEGRVREVVKDFQKSLRKAVLARVVKLVNQPQEVEWSHEVELDNRERLWIGMRRM